MSNYYDIYRKRLNRFGNDYQSRIQGAREYNFEFYLLKSVYRVDFEYEDEIHPGTLERNKQDNSEVRQYLLTRVDLNIPNGTILDIVDKDGVYQKWMIFYLENIKASGYNRYIVLKMTHFITAHKPDGTTYTTYAYLYGQENNMLKDEIRSRSRSDVVYSENMKLSFFISPANENIKKDDYLIVGEEPFQEYFRVTGYDIQSTPGVAIVSIDPIYQYDLTAAPSMGSGDVEEDFFWLNGGIEDGT